MNVIKDLVFDIKNRINDPGFNPGTILRTLNDLYHMENRELQCLFKKLSLPAGTFSDTVKSYALPGDYVRLFAIIPGCSSLYTLTYINQEKWNPNQYRNQNVFTMLAGEFVFGNVSAESSFDLYYWSTGKTLIDAEDTEIGEGKTYSAETYSNSLEWPADFHRLLVYETCLELVDYPKAKQDALKAEELRTNLRKWAKNQQAVTPQIIGGLGGGNVQRDPDYVDGLWVTRH